MRSYGELTGRYDSQATMDVYTYINKDAKRGAAGAVPEMFWAYGRRPLDSAARLWYTGIGDPKRMASKCRGLYGLKHWTPWLLAPVRPHSRDDRVPAD